ncbi:MAG: O-antigen polymerase [Candidatus Moranbacteria bacterium GW2011_GWE2_47_10]|nr:MAG: O-antigen polymerase [Candidatus Moranbacteria bacterium GW2011_GWE2_47_10]HBP01523.1 hypothetical protein [Candidatus Moranbacteria bacterium]
MANYPKNRETISAIFAIAFVSLFLLFGFVAGFSLAVYALTVVPAALIAFFHPRSGLFAIIFLTFIFERFFTLSPIILGESEYKIYPLDVMLLAIIFGTFLQFLKGQLGIRFKKADFLILGFAALSSLYGLASIFILNHEAALSFSSAKNYAFYALLYFATYLLVRTKEDFLGLVKFAVAGAIGIIGFLFYGALSGQGLWSEYTPLSTEGVRILAFTHGYYLSIVSIFAFAYILVKKKDAFASAFVFLLPVWGIGIVGSMMRHLWISIAAAFFAVLVLAGKETRGSAKRLLGGYFFVAFFVVAAVFYAASLLPNSKINDAIGEVTGVVGHRVTSIADSSDESIFWRNVVWSEAFKEYRKNPLFGTGFGKYLSVEIGSYREFVEMRNMHNSFLVLLVQMGLVSAVVLAGAVWILLKKVLEKIRTVDGMQIARIATVGILCLQAAAFMFQPYLETNLLGIFFWINLGLMRSLGRENEQTGGN